MTAKTPAGDAPEPLRTTKEPSCPIVEDEFDEFDQWYKHVPRKEGKGQARRAFKAARKKADLPTLIEGIRRYAMQVKAKETERQYVAMPATWLNGERWTDETSPSSSGDPDIERWNRMGRSG